MSRRFTVIDAEQRSPEWFTARAGRLTASVAGDMLATLKSKGEPACRRDLRTRLALERIVGRPIEDDYVNGDMKRGIELEPLARNAYEAQTGELVTPVGFLAHTALMAGCSPDGLIGEDGGVEFKAPRPATHLRYLQSGVLPAEHEPQIVHTLWLTGAAWWDFVSFCPLFPEPLQLFVVRVARDETAIAAYDMAAALFLAEVAKEVEAIQKLAVVAA